LADDAKSLYDLARFPTVTALAILSIEESGKVTTLRGLATAPLQNFANSVGRISDLTAVRMSHG